LRAWTELERRQAIRHGQWIPKHPGRRLRGYHLTQLLSLAASADRLLREWHESQHKPSALQVFYNSTLGVPYVADGARLDVRLVEEAMERGGQPMAATSRGSVAGIDVGPTWLHVVIAEPRPEMLHVLWVGKLHDWTQLTAWLRAFAVQCYVIDAMPETHQARQLLRQIPCGYLCYYSGPGRSVHVDEAERVIRVPRTESLDAMYARWRKRQVTLPRDVPAEFAQQVTALVRTLRPVHDGQPVAEYVAGAEADHYAHAMNYCELALGLRPQPLRFEVSAPQGGILAWE
jgi:hypothetical protein